MVSIYESFNTESLNERAPHFNKKKENIAINLFTERGYDINYT